MPDLERQGRSSLGKQADVMAPQRPQLYGEGMGFFTPGAQPRSTNPLKKGRRQIAFGKGGNDRHQLFAGGFWTTADLDRRRQRRA